MIAISKRIRCHDGLIGRTYLDGANLTMIEFVAFLNGQLRKSDKANTTQTSFGLRRAWKIATVVLVANNRPTHKMNVDTWRTFDCQDTTVPADSRRNFNVKYPDPTTQILEDISADR